MGQNFLVEPEVVEMIVEVANISVGDRVVEVGPGMGILTRELLAAEANVLAVELDTDLVSLLSDELGDTDNFSLVERDARHIDVSEWTRGEKWQVVANLPYSTGTVIVRHFLEMAVPPSSLTVMVQREVAERMVATSPNMSLLSLAVQVFAETDLAFIVPPDVFEPPPKVESAVVRLDVRPKPLADEVVMKSLFALATMAFQRKRKTIANGLSQGLGLPKSDVESMLAEAGIDPGLRPQAVGLDQWLSLARIAGQ
jgi:16S rRNA (adenine1518-N6/adenine1519-N6)-dimethyltransferase